MALLRRIELYLRRNRMAPTRSAATRSAIPRFVFDLRNGREPRPTTRARVHPGSTAQETSEAEPRLELGEDQSVGARRGAAGRRSRFAAGRRPASGEDLRRRRRRAARRGVPARRASPRSSRAIRSAECRLGSRDGARGLLPVALGCGAAVRRPGRPARALPAASANGLRRGSPNRGRPRSADAAGRRDGHRAGAGAALRRPPAPRMRAARTAGEPIEPAQQQENEREHRDRTGRADGDPRGHAERRLGGGQDRGESGQADQFGQQIRRSGEDDERDREAGERRRPEDRARSCRPGWNPRNNWMPSWRLACETLVNRGITGNV